MISKLSKKVVSRFISCGNITENEQELYEYGIFILLSNILFISLTIILGLVFGLFLQSLIFFSVFTIIRQYAGGYHASTESRCEIITTLGFLVSIITMRLIVNNLAFTILLISSMILFVFIFSFAPIDTDEKPLNEEELKVFCKRTKIILVIVVATIIVSLCLNLKMICIPCCMSLILEGILLLAGKAQKLKAISCESN